MEKDLGAAARDLAFALLDLSDLPLTGWTITTLSERSDKSVAHIVLHLSHDDHAPLVLKYEARPVELDDFSKRLTEHHAAMGAFAQSAAYRLPRIIAADPVKQAVLMEYIPARPATEKFEASGADLDRHAHLLSRIGGWVDAFHRARKGPPRPFQTHYTLTHLSRMEEAVSSGWAKIAAPEQFLEAARALRGQAFDFEGKQTIPSVQHADLHLRNVLLNDDVVVGVDFSGGHSAPVGHDLARLLVDYAVLHAPEGSIPKSQVIPPRAMEGFFETYRLIGPEDPAFQMMLRMRLLAEWRGLPGRDEDRSHAQDRRLAGVLRVARGTFDL